MSLFETLSQELKHLQSPARYRHSLAVARLAAKLGRRYGWEPERAKLAGLLHDWAKEWPPQALVQYVRSRRLRVPALSLIVKTAPNLLHAYVSADVARSKKWLRHPEDVRAVAAHTLGAPVMGTAEKILYVADLASPDRRYREAAGIRKQALQDLDQGFAAAVALKLSYQLRKRRAIHPLPIHMWNRVVCRLPAGLVARAHGG